MPKKPPKPAKARVPAPLKPKRKPAVRGPKLKPPTIARHSMYRGVTWHAPSEQWVAYITIHEARTHLGYYITEIAAAGAYNAAVLRLLKEADGKPISPGYRMNDIANQSLTYILRRLEDVPEGLTYTALPE